MHQPQYQDQLTGEYVLPWTYLHAIKDYVDMAAHLEAHPNAKSVVNFAPVLLEQIADYAHQIAAFRTHGVPIRDFLLAVLAGAKFPRVAEERLAIITACLRVNRERLINRFEPYRNLAEMADLFMQNPSATIYVANQFLVDLVVWYHLAWLGETVRRGDARVRALIEKGGQFTAEDQATLLALMGELIAGIVPRYRALRERGQVELAFSPYAHPIVPLLLDLGSALDAMPDAPMPYSPRYPGGEERARWHLHEGLRVFEKHFGFRPIGCWPSEGSVSVPALRLFSEHQLKWVATGSNVLRNSIAKSALDPAPHPHQPFHVDDGGDVACFFRDDGLSDLIGFTYSTWHADDAVANLMHHLESIAKAQTDPHKAVVSIILDGENAWEYFPENGYYFLSALYKKLSENVHLNVTTFSECLDNGVVPGKLPKLMAGSWVYGTFSTWIGDKDKNRGWDMLVDIKRAFDRVTASGRLSGEKLARAQRQLAICEGSDWFWWFGGYNPGDVVSDFERLFRRHLTGLYLTLGEEPPEYLSHTFTHGSGAPAAGGVMRPGSA
jgi:alpha-amylase/alpha-mannosidase (GH57 family)